MWKDCRPFELDVKDGWHLHLGNSDKQIRIPVPAGHYHGMVGEGFEMRKDKNFLCQRPLYVIQGNPHPKLLELWQTRQDIYWREDCMGYIPNYLHPARTCRSDEDDQKCDSNENKNLDYSEDDEEDCSDEDEWIDYSYDPFKEQSIEIPSKGCSNAKLQNCMYLGPDIPSKIHLELKEVVHEWVFSVHDSRNGNMHGYLINMVTGISGPDFERFHSDEGYYVVGVVRNAEKNPVDCIALLGNQNELTVYDLDYFREE